MNKHIFERLQQGELVPLTDPDFVKVDKVVTRTLALTPAPISASLSGLAAPLA